MMQSVEQLQSRNATSSELSSAKRSMAKIRKEIAAFHDLRRKNNEIAAGLRVTPLGMEMARSVIRENRDLNLEQQAVSSLRQFLSIVHGREPNAQEMRTISPVMEERLSMGAWPAVIAVGLATAGMSTYQIFSHLRDQEERIFLQTASPIERLMYLTQKNIKALAVLGTIGAGGYLWYKHTEIDAIAHGEEPPGVVEAIMGKMRSLLGKDEAEEEEEEPKKESGPKKNPGKIEAEKLYKMMSDEEKDRFRKMLTEEEGDGEEYEDEEIEEIDFDELDNLRRRQRSAKQ